jgi:DNA segregation ATPase FtsK/SpoIIIE, S-DNA-T family
MSKKRGRPSKSKEINIQSDETRLVFGLVLGLFAVFCFLSYFNEGEVFAILKSYFGGAVLSLGLLSFGISLKLFGMKLKFLGIANLFGLALVTLAIAALFHVGYDSQMAFNEAEAGNGGGLIGYFLSSRLTEAVSKNGAIVSILVFLFLGALLFTNTTLTQIRDLLFKSHDAAKDLAQKGEELAGKLAEGESEDGEQHGLFVGALSGKDRLNRPLDPELAENLEKKDADDEPSFVPPVGSLGAKEDTSGDLFGKIMYPNWKLPPLDLLEPPVEYKIDVAAQKKNSQIIEQTLRSFGIQAKVVDVVQGPTVSQYALSISVGTKVAKITNLAHDIALALAAPSGKVRIDAPIPGTSLVGIEVPNEEKTVVKLRSVMESKEMNNLKHKLPMPVGLDVAGRAIVKDITRMPHLLVAGQTGSGKSVAINTILMGLLMKFSPDALRLIMVDPKRVEMAEYNGIPHLLHPVIERADKVANALDWSIGEMTRRYDLFTQVRARNIETYNNFMGFTALPYIVIVIDEMADLMMMKKVDVESKIVRLAQMARATGIHLLLATQRPSVDVVTGLIKANIPARMALTVATSIDSRVILDSQGADALLGNGDMLLVTSDMNKPVRVQGAVCGDPEIKSVLDFIKEQSEEELQYLDELTEAHVPEGAITLEGGVSPSGSDDPLFKQAVQIVINRQKASASRLQRELSVGYNRAARLIDEMEASGIVGPQDGSKPRKVLITDISALENSDPAPEQPQV